MLTAFDDFPIHQTSRPVAYPANSDRNFFDRYYFNGESADGEVFFACALGVYPNLGVVDASFSVVVDGQQHNVRASRELDWDRATTVGPLTVEVLDPLRRLAVRIDCQDAGVHADLVFSGRAEPIEEPHFTRLRRARTLIDYTRLTQHGGWAGTLTAGGRSWSLGAASAVLGVRDRSWGVRPIATPDSQQAAPPAERVMSWIWAPLHFEDKLFLFDVQGDLDNCEHHRSGKVIDLVTGSTEEVDVTCLLTFEAGDPHAREAEFHFERADGGPVTIQLRPYARFSMSGVGYQHSAWGHGMYHGKTEMTHDVYDLADIDFSSPLHRHIQARSTATWISDEECQEGRGCLEQLYVPAPLAGPHLQVRAASRVHS